MTVYPGVSKPLSIVKFMCDFETGSCYICIMKYLVWAMLLIFACKKAPEKPADNPGIPGGKGGNKHIAVFPLQGTTGITGKVFIRYGTKTAPSSFSQYDDSSATMIEPGFGPHAHFLSLKPGFYAIGAYGYKGSVYLHADTLIEIRDTQPQSVDYKLQLK
jgi:hypothetical protein